MAWYRSTVRAVGILVLAGAGFVFEEAPVNAAILNLVEDPGFENLSGTEPDSDSSPWLTNGEDNDFSVTSAPVTQNIRSGNDALVFSYYYDDAIVLQNLNARWSTSRDYALSAWTMYDDPSGNVAHENSPDLSLILLTSPTLGGTYTWRYGIYWPNPGEDWTQINANIDGADIPAAEGEYIQIRLVKSNTNTSHRIFVDDVVFGIRNWEPGDNVPEPGTAGLFIVGALAVWLRRRKARAFLSASDAA